MGSNLGADQLFQLGWRLWCRFGWRHEGAEPTSTVTPLFRTSVTVRD